MGYDLTPNNKEIGEFSFGAFSWLTVLETCGYLFPEVSYRGRYIVIRGIDPRHERGSLGTNDGFPVTDEEARIMARMCRNFVAVQRHLPPQPEETDILTPAALEPWPRKIREDWVDKIEQFAEWADQSGGFEIH